MPGRSARVPVSRRLVLWSLPIAYMALIFAVSSTTWAVTIPSEIPFRDKGVHFCEYLLLGFLCAHATRLSWPTRDRARTLAFGALIAFAWGLGDELHQAFVPGRSAELLDLTADALGASCGAIGRALIERIWPSRFAPSSLERPSGPPPSSSELPNEVPSS